MFTGEIPSDVAAAYAVLKEAQAASVASATIGASCESIDAAARDIIAAAAYGEYFVHRTGHGIGMDAHEDPYIVSGNTLALADGHAFSLPLSCFSSLLSCAPKPSCRRSSLGSSAIKRLGSQVAQSPPRFRFFALVTISSRCARVTPT